MIRSVANRIFQPWEVPLQLWQDRRSLVEAQAPDLHGFLEDDLPVPEGRATRPTPGSGHVWDLVERFDAVQFGISQPNDQTLESSFSSVSKPIFATKYSFFSFFRGLKDLHTFAPLQIQNVRKNS